MEQALFSLSCQDENSFTAYFVLLKVYRSATQERGPGGGGLLSSSMCRIKYKSGSSTLFGGLGYIKELFLVLLVEKMISCYHFQVVC